MKTIMKKINLKEEVLYVKKDGTEVETTLGKAYAMKAKLNLMYFIRDVAIMLFFGTMIAGPVMVATGSMTPTLEVGHWALVVYPMSKNLDHEDIVMFTYPEEESYGEKKIVKRVIGLPGDVISVTDGVVTRNGVALEEDYILDENANPYGKLSEFTIPEGEMFVLGDYRINSIDCMDIAGHTIPLAGVEGKIYELGWFGSVMGSLTSWKLDS